MLANLTTVTNHSTPLVFHGIASGGDPSSGVFFSNGGAIDNGKVCTDRNGRKIPSGIHYVPGPDDCTLCICEDGGPKWCKAVLCAPRHDCKSFRVGNSCCEFICLDDSLGDGVKTGGPFSGHLDLSEVVPKIIVVAITAILSLSLLLFLIHRLRQKQLQERMNSAVGRRCDDCDDNRSLDFSMDFFDRGPPPPQYLAWWKPPSSYFPPREAPPPYEVAIASTSNCMPLAFTNAYNNNNMVATNQPDVVITAPSSTVVDATSGNATTSLSAPVEAKSLNMESNITNQESLNPSETFVQPSIVQNLNALSHPVNASGQSQGNPKGKEKRHGAKQRNNIPIASQSSNPALVHHPRPSSSSATTNTDAGGNALANTVTVPMLDSSIYPIRGLLHHSTVPPPYDEAMRGYGERSCFRHSLTLPRRAEFQVDRTANEFTQDNLISSRGNQRFSLQFNVAGWSSASSSTLSLSTPNSPNGLCRPPSLSSSSSSNVSHSHV